MPINFPTSPTLGQEYTFNNTTWSWNGTAWGIAKDTIALGELNDVSDATPLTGQALIWSGTEWAPSNVSTDANVISVNGKTGVVTLSTTDISEGSNLYYTNARAQALITPAYDKANTATTIASAAFDSSNTKVATVVGVTSTTISNAQVAAAIATTALSNLTIIGDINIGGNVNLTGNVTTFTANDLVLTDPLIYIGEDNTGDVVDLGIVASFTNPGYQHTGFVRDATDGKWKLFANVVAEPTTTVDFTNATYSTLKLGSVESDTGTFTGNVSTGNVSGTVGTFTNSRLGTVQSGTWNGSSISTTYTDAKVTTVANQTGAISNVQLASAVNQTGILTTANVSEVTNLYFTNARVAAAISGQTLTNAIFSANVNAANISVTSNINAGNISISGASRLGTVAAGTWQGTSISTTYTDAKITSVGGATGAITNAQIASFLSSATISNVTITGNTVITAGNLVVDTSALFVNSLNNRVGINTATPSANLHVVGNILSSSNVNAAYFVGDGSALSNIAAATVLFQDARPSTTSGNVLWWQSNVGKLKLYYNDGTSGQWVDASPGGTTNYYTNVISQTGITNETSKASTSGTSVDFTDIPNWVKRVTIMFNGVSTNGGSEVIIQLGSASGFVTSGYTGAASTIRDATSPGADLMNTGFLIRFGTTAGTAAAVRHGTATINNFSGNTWTHNHTLALSNSIANSVGAGTLALGNALTQIRITTVNGTDAFDAGSINLIYE